MAEEAKPAKVFMAPKYPHMGPIEAQIWDEFLRKSKFKFIKIDYDVRVGPGAVPKWLREKYQWLKKAVEDHPELRREYEVTRALYKEFSALTRLRIDAVGETKYEIWIFEVKPRAARSALGQLISYGYWYKAEFKPTKPIKLAVVCAAVDPNLKPVFERMGIWVFNVREM